MNNRIMACALILTGLAMNAPAMAGHPSERETNERFDYAKVISAEPIVREVRVSIPREECWDEDVPVYRSGYQSATPMILGGIIGGVVGNTMGKGHGKDAATVAGTILGGSVGRDIGHDRQRPSEYNTVRETRCRQVVDYREEERIEGYWLTYRYQGEDYVTRMQNEPGNRIRVRVTVQPDW
jgi:uncharacterized protein YcfJ